MQNTLSFRRQSNCTAQSTNDYRYRSHFSGRFMAHDPARGSDWEVFETSRVESGWVPGCWRPHGSGRVGSGGVQKSHGSVPCHPDTIRPARHDLTRAGDPSIFGHTVFLADSKFLKLTTNAAYRLP